MGFLIVLSVIGLAAIILTLRAVSTDGYRRVDTRAGYDSRSGREGNL